MWDTVIVKCRKDQRSYLHSGSRHVLRTHDKVLFELWNEITSNWFLKLGLKAKFISKSDIFYRIILAINAPFVPSTDTHKMIYLLFIVPFLPLVSSSTQHSLLHQDLGGSFEIGTAAMICHGQNTNYKPFHSCQVPSSQSSSRSTSRHVQWMLQEKNAERMLWLWSYGSKTL